MKLVVFEIYLLFKSNKLMYLGISQLIPVLLKPPKSGVIVQHNFLRFVW